MQKTLARCVATFGLLLIATTTRTSATAQGAPWRIVQSGDGTLYLLAGDTRYVINPDQVADEELAALTDGGTLGSQLPLPPAPAPVAVLAQPEVATPTATLVPPTNTPIPPTNTPVPAPAVEQPSTITGSGFVTSRPFSLRGGNYTITWTWTASGAKCLTSGAQIHPVNGIGEINVGSSSIDLAAGQSSSGETQAYNVTPGPYFVRFYGSCDWSVTVKPQ